MKKYALLLITLVFIAAIFVGCGCRNSRPMNTTAPTTLPTPTTMPTTAPTASTTETTMPTETTQETIEDGNGPLPTNATAGADGDTSGATETTPMEGSARNMPRNNEK